MRQPPGTCLPSGRPAQPHLSLVPRADGPRAAEASDGTFLKWQRLEKMRFFTSSTTGPLLCISELTSLRLCSFFRSLFLFFFSPSKLLLSSPVRATSSLNFRGFLLQRSLQQPRGVFFSLAISLLLRQGWTEDQAMVSSGNYHIVLSHPHRSHTLLGSALTWEMLLEESLFQDQRKGLFNPPQGSSLSEAGQVGSERAASSQPHLTGEPNSVFLNV